MNLRQAVLSDWLIFTDLDGTLLDHHSYSAAAAQSTLERLAAAAIPVVFTSSKTYAELRVLMDQLAVTGPAIGENGACIHLPEDWVEPSADKEYVLRLSPPYADIIALLNALRERHGYAFTGFADLSDDEVAGITGLTATQARLARTRDGSEPLLWADSAESLQEFEVQLAQQGLKTLQGGRFLHVLGADADKVHAVNKTTELLRAHGWRGRTLALGDAPNDHAMLSAVDQPVLIHNPEAVAMPQIDNPLLYRSAQTGPRGWREAIDRLIPKEKTDE